MSAHAYKLELNKLFCRRGRHDLRDNGSRTICISCGYMKIVDNFGITLPDDRLWRKEHSDEIVAKIVCMNKIFYGLTISKGVCRESIKYTSAIVLEIPFGPKELKLCNLGERLIMQCFPDIYQVWIIKLRSNRNVMLTRICKCSGDTLDTGKVSQHMYRSDCSYNIASDQIKI